MAKDVDIDAIAGDDTTFTDDLMPNDGLAFDDSEQEDRSPEHDTKVEADAEAEMILGSAPIIGHINNWLLEEIKATDSIALAHIVAKQYKCSVENALIALDLVAKTLEIKRQNIDTLKRIYIDQTE